MRRGFWAFVIGMFAFAVFCLAPEIFQGLADFLEIKTVFIVQAFTLAGLCVFVAYGLWQIKRTYFYRRSVAWCLTVSKLFSVWDGATFNLFRVQHRI